MKTIKILFLTLVLFPMQLLSQALTVSNGIVEVYPDFESQYLGKRTIAVWLPENYNPRKRYAVLYMHDGQMLFDASTTWNSQEWGVDECITQLYRDGKIQNTIVVGIWNAGKDRHPEYFPQKPFESLSDKAKNLVTESLREAGRTQESFKPYSDTYLKFIVEEVKPFVDKTYATRKEKAYTFIAGSSMGGLISLYALCEYPEIFGGAACLSTHWPGTFAMKENPIPNAFYTYLKNNLPTSNSCKIYFDYGTETLDAVYEPLQQEVDNILKTKGFDEKHWITRKFVGADHSENAWKERLHIPFEFLLTK
jgi:predicted alpha/beta superfamily hydrolase